MLFDMKRIIILGLLLPIMSHAQETIEWSRTHTFKPSDFKAAPPNTGDVQSVYAYCGIDYKAKNFQLLFGNLNPLVSNTFSPNASWLDKGNNTEELLKYAQTSWDLNELSARKFRKRIHENRSKLSVTKMNAYLQDIMTEHTKMLSLYSKESNYGRDKVIQDLWEVKVDSLLDSYSAYCKHCKKPRKAKRSKSKK